MRPLEPPDPDATASAFPGFDESLNSITTTAKWIVSSAAAVLAVLVAGLQVSQVGALPAGRMSVALGAYALAVAGAGRVLLLAARVLITPGFTVSDLADREMRARLKAVRAARGDPQQVDSASRFDPLLSALARRRRELLPGQADDLDLQSFYTGHVELVATWAAVGAGRSATLHGTTYRSDEPAGLASLRAKLADSSRTAATLIDAAHLYVAKERYRRLVRGLTAAGIAVVIAIPVFAVASHENLDEAGARVGEPVEVAISVNGRAADLDDAGVPEECESREWEGTAVGGTYPQPLVVVTSPADCRGVRVLVTPEIGVAAPATGGDAEPGGAP